MILQVMVNNPLIRPYFLGEMALGGTLPMKSISIPAKTKDDPFLLTQQTLFRGHVSFFQDVTFICTCPLKKVCWVLSVGRY